MTDEAPRRRRIKPPGPFAVVAAASGVFFGLVGAFAIQERLATPASAQPPAAAPPAVLVRRVIVTRVVTDGRRTSAPAATTSAPPPPPAAAPAPAPLTTRTS